MIEESLGVAPEPAISLTRLSLPCHQHVAMLHVRAHRDDLGRSGAGQLGVDEHVPHIDVREKPPVASARLHVEREQHTLVGRNSGATRRGKVGHVKKAYQSLGLALAVASLSVLTGCSTVHEAMFPTGTWWGYVAPSPTTGADALIITYDRVACNTARARYVKRIGTPVYIDECRQVYLEKGEGYWIIPAVDVDGYLGSRSLQECETMGRRQFSDYGQGDRVCQSARVDFR